MEKPDLYQYSSQDNQHKLYVGNFQTYKALSFLNPLLSISNLELGATNYKDLGFASSEDLPQFKTVLEIGSFLKEEDLDLIDFQVKIQGGIMLSSHDDYECNLEFPTKTDLVKFLNKIIKEYSEFDITSVLLNNNGIYINYNQDGSLNKYSTFDAYLKST